MSSGQPSLRPVSGVLAVNRDGRVLLVQRADDLSWGLPGGGVEPGESWAAAAVRECFEETGWQVEIRGVFGVYSDPETQIHAYPDGRRVHFVGVVFVAGAVAQVGRSDDEVLDVAFFAPDDLPGNLFGPDRPVLLDFLLQGPGPVIA